jgi:DNA invertase Pin-like site-specific DNA recombinase
MNTVYAYIRVSTQRQGVLGASLAEQRSAIGAYAERQGLVIGQWFEERETAAKSGRPHFKRMMAALARGEAQGVIFHKIDRGARNFRDWADIGDLNDRGVAVHFAHESVDLHSRSGRLSADIQAVVAADYIRNLRQEVVKGITGRLKQGLYPFAAPVGYRDCGKAQVKQIDPLHGPLVRQAFELYATGEWTFKELLLEMRSRGLKGRNGAPMSKDTFTKILNNPFYYGVIHVKTTGQYYEGVHEPLVSKALWDQVQSVLRGIRPAGSKSRQRLVFRRLIRCGHCSRTLIGEVQKGRYVYYRCHNRACAVVSIPERVIDDAVLALFALLRFRPDELRDLRDIVDDMRVLQVDDKEDRKAQIALGLAKCDERLRRLTDLLVENTIDSAVYNARRYDVLDRKAMLHDELAGLDAAPSRAERIANDIELAETAYFLYQNGTAAEKRDLVSKVTSNCTGTSKSPAFTLRSPFRELADWRKSQHGAHRRDGSHTRVAHILAFLAGVSVEDMSATIAAIGTKRPRRTVDDEPRTRACL